MSLEITIDSFEDKWRGRPGFRMLVKHNGEIIAEELDNGEPEDNSFYRDYAWIKPLLEKVYELGKGSGQVLLRKEYSGESIVDIEQDVSDAIADSSIPTDEHGFHQGNFQFQIIWNK